MTDLRFGIIGCGWAGDIRAKALAGLPEFRLTAVADMDAARARAMAEKHGAAAADSWQDLICRDDVDAVLVSTPPQMHAEMGIAAMERGKHVLCEKPLARHPDECRQILETAKKTGRTLGTGFNYRFYLNIAKAREILDSGLIGELDHIRSFAGHPGGNEFTHDWVKNFSVMGGGTLMDNGIHIVDLTRYFLGEVAEIKGYRSFNVFQFEGCEDNGFAILKSPTGKIAQLQASWNEWRGYRYHVEVYGTRGCVRASYSPMMTQVNWVTELRGQTQKKLFLFPKFQVLERMRSYRWTAVESFKEELLAFRRTMSGEKTASATGFDGMRAVQIAHAIYQSAETGETVLLDD